MTDIKLSPLERLALLRKQQLAKETDCDEPAEAAITSDSDEHGEAVSTDDGSQFEAAVCANADDATSKHATGEARQDHEGETDTDDECVSASTDTARDEECLDPLHANEARVPTDEPDDAGKTAIDPESSPPDGSAGEPPETESVAAEPDKKQLHARSSSACSDEHVDSAFETLDLLDTLISETLDDNRSEVESGTCDFATATTSHENDEDAREEETPASIITTPEPGDVYEPTAAESDEDAEESDVVEIDAEDLEPLAHVEAVPHVEADPDVPHASDAQSSEDVQPPSDAASVACDFSASTKAEPIADAECDMEEIEAVSVEIEAAVIRTPEIEACEDEACEAAVEYENNSETSDEHPIESPNGSAADQTSGERSMAETEDLAIEDLTFDFSDFGDETVSEAEPDGEGVREPVCETEQDLTADAVDPVEVVIEQDAEHADQSEAIESILDEIDLGPRYVKSGRGGIRKVTSHANTQLDDLFARVNDLLGESESEIDEPWKPPVPQSLADTGLTEEDVERITLKFLSSKGSASGREISGQLKLPFTVIEPLLKEWKHQQLIGFKNSAEMGDYVYVITDSGREKARAYMTESTYFGAAPVQLVDYLKAMEEQSIAKQHATEADLKRAFNDLLISPAMLERLGPAVNSGRGMFLFGEPGNGKTSIAERITACFGSTIWIPRALGIDGDIIRLFDPGVHEAVDWDAGVSHATGGLFDVSGVDPRWVRITRPTVVAGGELTMDELEVTQNPHTKVCEAPLQLKSNCGTLVIDDFGRQTMPVDQLLNRWIVPLEKRYDFLNLPSGKKIQVPFDQLIVFSTNLEPKDLVDGAFLRRIPYKIEVPDPLPEHFRQLFHIMAPNLGLRVDDEAIDYLISEHFEKANRPFRACLPRDLLLQVRNYCNYKSTPKVTTPEAFDFAVANYFSVM